MKLFNKLKTIDSLPLWVTNTYSEFNKLIFSKSPVFPCYFAHIAEKNNALYYTYVDYHEIDKPLDLVSNLSEYLSLNKSLKNYSALVVFVRLQSNTLIEHENTFWNLLQFIHDNDTHKWPNTVPADVNNAKWIFCFNETPLFINGHSNAYKLRKSRYAPCELMLIIQPYSNIDKLSKDINSIHKISNTIRDNVKHYDDMSISKVFGINFADSKALNWEQYWLTESDEILHNTCPLKIKTDEKIS